MSEAVMTQAARRTARLWEIDTLRGVAVVAMVLFHLMWDLSDYGIYPADVRVGPWQLVARTIGTTFIALLGLSATLTYAQQRRKLGTGAQADRLIAWRFVQRGLFIFGCGLVITAATYWFKPSAIVVFGVLHLLGAALVLLTPFLFGNRWISLAAGVLVIGVGLIIQRMDTTSVLMTSLGMRLTTFYMSDWYPLFPWFGVALLGAFAGKTLYPDGARGFALGDGSDHPVVRGLSFLGQHSLIIYLVHQPLLIGVLEAWRLGQR